jgi:Cys-rich four helix bundle protein (predicted Tat secretion target)
LAHEGHNHPVKPKTRKAHKRHKGHKVKAQAGKALEEHEEHEHGTAPHQALIDAALNCVNRGEVCVNHCVTMLETGDTSLKDCLRTVSAMLPMCTALAPLAALDAKHLRDFAKVCIEVCTDCEDACKKHQDEHEICKACAQSCAECIEECKKLT